jgi:hypothetical protein
MGLLAGAILVALIVIGLFVFAGPFKLGGGKDVNVHIETPKLNTKPAG